MTEKLIEQQTYKQILDNTLQALDTYDKLFCLSAVNFVHKNMDTNREKEIALECVEKRLQRMRANIINAIQDK